MKGHRGADRTAGGLRQGLAEVAALREASGAGVRTHAAAGMLDGNRNPLEGPLDHTMIGCGQFQVGGPGGRMRRVPGKICLGTLAVQVISQIGFGHLAAPD